MLKGHSCQLALLALLCTAACVPSGGGYVRSDLPGVVPHLLAGQVRRVASSRCSTASQAQVEVTYTQTRTEAGFLRQRGAFSVDC